MGTRAIIVSLCLVLGSLMIAGASKTEPVSVRQSFDTFPFEIGAWKGTPTERFDQRILTELAVDDYLNRVYLAEGAPSAVGLYIGNYQSQRQGDTMHSPLNCLPGAGWQPVRKERVAIQVREDTPTTGAAPADRPIVVNRLTIEKGLEKQVVLYWYQSHGRVVASEYWGKAFTVVDAIRLNRTDAAMIRIIAPVAGSESEAEANAERVAVQFAQAVFPLLGRYLPS